MILVTGRCRLKDGVRDEFIAAAAVMCAASREEAGCHAYRYGFDVEDDQVVLFHEEWADEAALQAHFAEPHFATFTAFVVERVEAGGEFTKWIDAARASLF